MVTQRTFSTRLLIYLLASGLFTYLPTSGLLFSGLIIYLLIYFRFIYLFSYYLLIYLLIYLHLMAYGHTPFPPPHVAGILSERQCQKHVVGL